MTNALIILGYIAAIVYGLLVDGTYFKIYFTLIVLYTVIFNNLLIDKRHFTKRKNITVTTWSEPTDPHAYLPINYNVSKTVQYIKKLNEMQKEAKITMTHIFSKGLMYGMAKNGRDFGRIRWGYFQKADKLGLTVLVDQQGGKDLLPVTIWDGHNQSIIEIAKYMNEKVELCKSDRDKAHQDVTKIFLQIPTYLLGVLTSVASYLAQNCGISIPPLNIKGNSWGHTVLTNIGTLQLEQGFAPIPCPIRCQLVACTGKIEKKPVVENDQIVIREIMNCVFTLDHRFGDAAVAVKILKIIKDYVEDPENFNIDNYEEAPAYNSIDRTKVDKSK